MPDDDAPLTIDLNGPQGHAVLTVEPPASRVSKPVEFSVPPLNSSGDGGQLVRISSQVIFTTATNERVGWSTWHVKIYRCASVGDADTLCEHLRHQANALQQVNKLLPGQRGKTFEPPWAVVPVQVVRGDGRLEKLAGAVTTRLGAPSDHVVAQLQRRLPRWLVESAPPECVLLAVSPQIDPLRWAGRGHDDEARPATEHLEIFETLAAGLDHLHRQNWAHCDIKPDNVCRCTFGPHSAYVLIDTDAATRTSPVPQVLRTTDLYNYRTLRDIRLGRSAGVRPGDLYAQDRFGLMLVVLSMLAGREWVEQVLLSEDATDAAGARIADSAEKTHHALTALWPDPRWQPLIRALAEPFGDGVHGRTALERREPWAAGWLGRVRAAEAQCGVPVAPEPAGLPSPPPAARRAVEDARRAARDQPAGKRHLVRRAHQAIEQVAQDLAASQAHRAMWIWGGGLTGAGLLVALNAFVIGR